MLSYLLTELKNCTAFREKVRSRSFMKYLSVPFSNNNKVEDEVVSLLTCIPSDTNWDEDPSDVANLTLRVSVSEVKATTEDILEGDTY